MVSTDILFHFPEITLYDGNKHKKILVQVQYSAQNFVLVL